MGAHSLIHGLKRSQSVGSVPYRTQSPITNIGRRPTLPTITSGSSPDDSDGKINIDIMQLLIICYPHTFTYNKHWKVAYITFNNRWICNYLSFVIHTHSERQVISCDPSVTSIFKLSKMAGNA